MLLHSLLLVQRLIRKLLLPALQHAECVVVHARITSTMLLSVVGSTGHIIAVAAPTAAVGRTGGRAVALAGLLVTAAVRAFRAAVIGLMAVAALPTTIALWKCQSATFAALKHRAIEALHPTTHIASPTTLLTSVAASTTALLAPIVIPSALLLTTIAIASTLLRVVVIPPSTAISATLLLLATIFVAAFLVVPAALVFVASTTIATLLLLLAAIAVASTTVAAATTTTSALVVVTAVRHGCVIEDLARGQRSQSLLRSLPREKPGVDEIAVRGGDSPDVL